MCRTVERKFSSEYSLCNLHLNISSRYYIALRNSIARRLAKIYLYPSEFESANKKPYVAGSRKETSDGSVLTIVTFIIDHLLSLLPFR